MLNSSTKQSSTGLDDSSGATMIEYALMASLIAVICVAAVSFLGQQASITFSKAADGFNTPSLAGP